MNRLVGAPAVVGRNNPQRQRGFDTLRGKITKKTVLVFISFCAFSVFFILGVVILIFGATTFSIPQESLIYWFIFFPLGYFGTLFLCVFGSIIGVFLWGFFVQRNNTVNENTPTIIRQQREFEIKKKIVDAFVHRPGVPNISVRESYDDDDDDALPGIDNEPPESDDEEGRPSPVTGGIGDNLQVFRPPVVRTRSAPRIRLYNRNE